VKNNKSGGGGGIRQSIKSILKHTTTEEGKKEWRRMGRMKRLFFGRMKEYESAREGGLGHEPITNGVIREKS